jgi:hypothetical protein
MPTVPLAYGNDRRDSMSDKFVKYEQIDVVCPVCSGGSVNLWRLYKRWELNINPGTGFRPSGDSRMWKPTWSVCPKCKRTFDFDFDFDRQKDIDSDS